MGNPGEGNAWHHIVEQSLIKKSGFSAEQIHNPENVIAIPHGKGSVHAKISGYYSSKPKEFGGLTVREYLSEKSFAEQFEFGLNVLKRYGKVEYTKNGYVFTPF